MRSAAPFTAITSEGGLLPTDFLQELVSPKITIEGVAPVAYHLAEGERIGEQVNRSWNRLQGCWQNFKKSIADKLPGDSTTTETRERWLLPLFQELDFGRLTAARAFEVEGRSYPISHTWNQVLIHLVGSHLDIDRRTPGATGAAKASPHSLVQQALNASDAHLWGVVSNGLTLRLLRDNIALTRMAYVEWDLQAVFDGDLYSEFFLLWLVCHESRFGGERPELCWLEKWKKASEDKGLRALENLRPGVEKAITALGEGLVSHQANEKLREKLRTGALSPQQLYEQVLRVVYRLLFLFVAEDRGLLHPPLPKNDKEAENTSLKARKRYDEFYSLSRLRGLTLYRAGTPHPDLWNAFQLICQKLGSDTGSPELALSTLGSFLWDTARSTPDLTDCSVSNRQFLTAIHALAFVQDGTVRRGVDYKNLGSEELGSVYESLLELHPVVNADAGTFELGTASGSERKTTGSYYTPDSLVQCLLDSALEPVMVEAVRGKHGPDVAERLLSLKVCDPAVGSGHFLIAAAHRIAKRVAAARSGEDEPSPESTRTALRDVIGRCLYGVDVNPMAAELCKVSLWLEALEPGKPLSFLDHHIRVGNSLLGSTPLHISQGIPDDAFKPIEGDDKKACAALKKLNARERTGFGELFVREDASNFESLRQAALSVDELADDTPEALHQKEAAFAEAHRNYTFLRAQHLADAWCAAFVIQKVFRPGTTGSIGITQSTLRKVSQGEYIGEDLNTEIQRLARQYQFFHSHLEFPDVFGADGKGGFDVSLGNPPWERVKLQEKEWFAANGRPDIANAPNATARGRLIAALSSEEPGMWAKYLRALRLSEGGSHFMRNSGLYPLCGRGDINVYTIFAERMRNLLRKKGYFGAVLPTGVVTDETTQFFFQNVVETKSLVSVFDFENREGFFPAVDSRMKFCLFTCGSISGEAAMAADFVFFAHALGDLRDPQRRYSLSREDMQTLNPNTLTCPVFRTRADAELSLEVHRRIPLFRRETAEQVLSPWDCDLERGFRQGEDEETLKQLGFERSKLLFTCDEVQGKNGFVPLVEGKTFDIYDHRAASIVLSKSAVFRPRQPVETPSELHRDPSFTATPYFWAQADVAKAKFPWIWFVAHKKVTSATNERTMVATILASCAVNDTVHVFTPSPKALMNLLPLLCANLCSFALDYLGRQKLGGNAYSMFVAKQLPLMPPSTYASPSLWAGGTQTLHDWLLPRVLELTNTAWDMEAFAQDCGWSGPPFRWNEERRFLLRCELDAAFFHLYLGQEDEWEKQTEALTKAFPAPRDAVSYIMDTFPIVKRKDEAKFDGDYRTKRVILEIYDALAESMRTGQSYKTLLNPLPASFRQAHLPRLPLRERTKFSDPEVYLAQFILNIVRQARDEADLDLLQDALTLLIHRQTHRAEIEALLGNDAWFKTFNAPLDPNIFRSLLERFVAGKVLLAFKDDQQLRLNLRNYPGQQSDPWVALDASVALSVLARRPDIQELLVDTLPASFKDDLQKMAVA
jgi:hypothetical protein